MVGASSSIGGFCGAVAASGSTVYLGSGSTLEIWDAQIPATPVRLGAIRRIRPNQSLQNGTSGIQLPGGAHNSYPDNRSKMRKPAT